MEAYEKLNGGPVYKVNPDQCCYDRKVTVLPVEIPQPTRTLGILRLEGRPRIPAAEKLARHISTRFDDLRQLIKRHEDAVVWGNSPP